MLFFLVLIINKFLLSCSPSRRISSLSSSSTCGYNNPRLLTSAYSRLLLSLVSVLRLSLCLCLSSLLSRSLLPLLFFLAHSYSLFPPHVICTPILSLRSHIVLSFLLFLLRSFPSSLSRDSSSSSSLFFLRHFFSLASSLRPPTSFSLFLSFPSHAYLSFFASRFILPLARVSDLVDFALSFYPPRSSPPPLSARLFLRFPRHSFTKRTLLSSRSIELRSSSSFYLVKFLVPPRPLLLLLLLLRPQSPPFLSTFLRAVLSLSLDPTGFSRRCASRSSPLFILVFASPLSFPLSLFLSRGGQELLILCRKLVRGPPDLFGWARMTLILKYYLAPPPPPPRGRARVCPPPPFYLVSRVWD